MSGTASRTPALTNALHRHYSRQQRWGFIWALWTAVLWGARYVPGTALRFEQPYVDAGFTRPPVSEALDVVVIGAGFSGLCTGARLRQAGAAAACAI